MLRACLSLVFVICASVVGAANAGQLSTRPAVATQSAPASRPQADADDKDYPKLLAEVDEKIQKAPDDGMLFYRRCQYLMKLKRYEEGYAAGKAAMAKFIAADNKLSWMLIDSIDLEHHRIDIHFNMGPDERNLPRYGISRPLSFRVWTKEKNRSLALIVDYEVAYVDGQPSTVAFGATTRLQHVNYGMLRPGMKYEDIREAARKLVPSLLNRKK